MSTYRKTNLGNQIVLEPPVLTGPLQQTGIPERKNGRKLIVEVDLEKEYPELANSQTAGSWVIALDARQINATVGGPPTPTPVKVIIEFGAGGVIQEVEVDPNQGLVSVPAGFVRVSAQWDTSMLLLPGVGTTGGTQYTAAEDLVLEPVIIRATLQRSYAAGFATKSFYLFRPSSGGDSFGRIKIPNFATSYQICGVQDTAQGDAGPLMFWTIEENKNLPSGLDLSLDEVANRPQAYQFILNYCTRNLPPAATDFRFTVEEDSRVAPQRFPFFLTFNLAFR